MNATTPVPYIRTAVKMQKKIDCGAIGRLLADLVFFAYYGELQGPAQCYKKHMFLGRQP